MYRLVFFVISSRARVKLFLNTLGIYYREANTASLLISDPMPETDIDDLIALARLDGLMPSKEPV